MQDITPILQKIESGDPEGPEQLLAAMYTELRRLAGSKLARESAAHTLQPTALVHEAWMRLGADQQPNWQNRAHFFAAAAEAMRRILIDRARKRKAVRHGGALARVNLNETGVDVAAPPESDDTLLAVHEALDRLAVKHARAAQVVKLKYFGGLNFDQIAETTGMSVPTAKRDWAFARAWLFREVQQD